MQVLKYMNQTEHLVQRNDIRNVAIIAHVDHGKTTLVDGLLKQAGTFRVGEVTTERAMDSNDLERERGITILSKCTAVTWKGVRINIVDTPGHADFGGEVERGQPPGDLAPLLDLIVERVPPAEGDPDAPLVMQVATLDYDDYLGYMAIGRMRAGRAKVGDRVLLAHRDGKKEEFRVQKVLGFQGLKRFELAEARAGDIVAFTGMQELNVGETITSITEPTVLP